MRAASGMIMEYPQLIFIKFEKVCSCRQQLDGVETQLGLAHEKAIRVDAANAELST